MGQTRPRILGVVANRLHWVCLLREDKKGFDDVVCLWPLLPRIAFQLGLLMFHNLYFLSRYVIVFILTGVSFHVLEVLVTMVADVSGRRFK